MKRSIKDRLRDLTGAGRVVEKTTPAVPATSEPIDQRREPPTGEVTAREDKQRVLDQLRRMVADRERGVEPPRVDADSTRNLPGEVMETPYGECLAVSRDVPLHSMHGDILLGDVLGQPVHSLAELMDEPGLAALDFRDAVMYDTETTGLTGGTGTYIFLSGCAFIENEILKVRQYFMRDPREERAMLWATNRVLAERRWVVTYNGRTFDMPLLETRYIATRLQEAAIPTDHFDLLFPARKLLRHRHGSCKLTHLERNALDFIRHGDIPGDLIPAVYFHFLRTGDTTRLNDVILHNQLDLISLVALAHHLLLIVNQPETWAGCEESFGLGSEYWRRGMMDRAEPHLERAMHPSAPARIFEEAAVRRWITARRRNDFSRGLLLLEDLAFRQGWVKIYALQELAKYFEHQAQDYETALDCTERAYRVLAGERIQRPSSVVDFPAPDSLLRRRERLRGKIHGDNPRHGRENGK
ncbi:ribonuclease H-like domain-containing protein [bacterium]|nr:ribonuclease H-like domain-containing protein [candidate division CSSED10-310 bacterium]